LSERGLRGTRILAEGEEREERERKTEKRIAQGTQAQSMKMATDSG
jgi:hypothetical protein